MDQFTADTFAAYRDARSLFRRTCHGEGAAPSSVDICAVTSWVSAPRRVAEHRAPFSLLFVSQEDKPLGAGLHRLDPTDFDPCDLLLTWVAVRPHARGQRTRAFYEAVFG